MQRAVLAKARIAENRRMGNQPCAGTQFGRGADIAERPDRHALIQPGARLDD